MDPLAARGRALVGLGGCAGDVRRARERGLARVVHGHESLWWGSFSSPSDVDHPSSSTASTVPMNVEVGHLKGSGSVRCQLPAYRLSVSGCAEGGASTRSNGQVHCPKLSLCS